MCFARKCQKNAKFHYLKFKKIEPFQCLTFLEGRRGGVWLFTLKMDFHQKLKGKVRKEGKETLRWCNDFRIPSIRTVYHGSESISFSGPKT